MQSLVCDNRTMKKKEKRKMHAFKMLERRRAVHMSHLERRTSQWVYQQLQVKSGDFKKIKHRMMTKYGCCKQREDSLTIRTVEGEVHGQC